MDLHLNKVYATHSYANNVVLDVQLSRGVNK